MIKESIPYPEENIPDELKELSQWVCWRLEQHDNDAKPRKVPYNPMTGKRAKSSDSATWGNFDDALKYLTNNHGMQGLGIMLGDGLSGTDIDNCVDETGALKPDAVDILTLLGGSYTEYSPSGKGLHVLHWGKKPIDAKSKAPLQNSDALEIYDTGRFFTVTGNILLDSTKTVEDLSAGIARVCGRYLIATKTAPITKFGREDYISDEALLASISGSKHGFLFEDLWEGSTEQYDGDDSRADAALVEMLLFFSRGNEKQTDHLFRQSGLMRDKWDRSAGGGVTYGERTIKQIKSRMARFRTRDYKLTDLGNAERLADTYSGEVRRCSKWRKWLIWDGKRWAIDDTGAVMQYAAKTVRAIYKEVEMCNDLERRKAISRHAINSESVGRLQAMVSLAESLLPVATEELDADIWLLNCQNGTLDLRTGQLRPHDPADMLTKIIPVSYDSKAQCPLFENFLGEIFNGDIGMIRFMQKYAGLSLCGDTSEQILAILYGGGANGKSVLMSTFFNLLGDYARNLPADALMTRKNESIPNDIAALQGVRMATASETADDGRLNEARIKAMTGGEQLTARFLHGEFFDFMPQFKLWLATNHRPKIRGTDKGIWRRIKLIPFEVTISDEKQDKHLTEKLQCELSGILTWAVRGLEAWRKEGLAVPEVVQKAGCKYQADMDVLAKFIDECCVIQDGGFTRARALYELYKAWAKTTGEYILSETKFSLRLAEKGLQKANDRNGAKWVGVTLSATCSDFAEYDDKVVDDYFN